MGVANVALCGVGALLLTALTFEEELGGKGFYGAAWLLHERIAQAWSGDRQD